MNVIDKKFEEICDAYAEYRNNNADLPKYFVLGVEARQAIKMHTHLDLPSRLQELKELFGVPVIPLEKSVVIE